MEQLLLKSIYDPRYLEVISRLRVARENLAISQVELASRLGKPQSYISKFETCERRLDLVEVLDICKALGINLQAIVPSDLQYLLYTENSTDSHV